VFRPITDRHALHVRRLQWAGRVGYERHDLGNGERHHVLWLGWTALTLLVRAPSPLPKHEQVMFRSEQRRLTRSLRWLHRQNAPADVINDTMSRLMDSMGREHRAKMAARHRG
jgi:hypothetical protein